MMNDQTRKGYDDGYISGYEDCLIKYSTMLINDLNRRNSERKERIAELKRMRESLEEQKRREQELEEWKRKAVPCPDYIKETMRKTMDGIDQEGGKP